MQPDVALDKIRKLLAMAEADGISEQARESYNLKAAELIARYGIDQARLDARQNRPATPSDIRLDMDPPYARDKLNLLSSIAVPLGCQIVSHTRRDPDRLRQQAHLFGMTADLDRAQILYTSLLVQSSYGITAARIPTGENPRAFRRSWLAGFAVAVYKRLTAAEAAAKARALREDTTSTGPSTALVLADRATLVQRHLTHTYPRLRKGRARQLSGSGGRDGYHAGERADLGGTRLIPTQRPALGS
ncbi:DUF2786 domain-containing protein [Frankia sp. BMG5.23]|uniref:DUF2786 domain-containing protein n=1 Tax=Frankia sp. BMG5.23 TaxID=683305 RepID=UPI000461122C|nr:DUF2786 domain-containing protein [Frankia sp. BMG5.23]KDA41614.1 hypothetical protein BMG523Draft_03552 [Frankia sp. BMG5.23]